MHVMPDLASLAPTLKKTGGPKEMLSLSELPDGRTKVRVNFSSLDILQTCPRKAYYVLERKLKSQNESPATLYGSAIHKALEVFYSHPSKERSLPEKFLEQARLIPFGTVPSESHFLFDAVAAFCEVARPLSALPDSDKRSLSTGVWTLFHYFKAYVDDPYVIYADETGPYAERDFTLPFYEDESTQVELFGRIDAILVNRDTGVILPTDHKTSSIVGPDFYNRLKPSHQYTAYLLGSRLLLNKPDLDSFLVNCIQVKPEPTTSRGQPPHFPRQVTKRNDGDIAEFTDVVRECVTNFLRYRSTQMWPLGPVNSCTAYGGCQFLDVCSAPGMLRENMLKAKYTTTGEDNALT